MTTILLILFLLVSVILILLVLIQRGRGGGLAGAFGGAGGSSAFGTKTADVFIKATAVLAAVFVLLAIVTAWYMRHHATDVFRESEPAPVKAPAEEGGETTGTPGTDAGTDAGKTPEAGGGEAAPAEEGTETPAGTAP